MRFILIALFLLLPGCTTYRVSPAGMPRTEDTEGIDPLLWATRVRYSVTCDAKFELCEGSNLRHAVGWALESLGHGWTATDGYGEPENHSNVLSLEFLVVPREVGSSAKRGTLQILSIVTLALIPYPDGRELDVWVTARRGTTVLFENRPLGGAPVTRIFAVNPLGHAFGSVSKNKAARVVAADMVVAAMRQLQDKGSP